MTIHGQPAIPYESRTNRYLRRRQEDIHYLRTADKIARETGIPITTIISAKLPGDEQALRGIPAIGRGVTGAQPDTRPGHGLD